MQTDYEQFLLGREWMLASHFEIELKLEGLFLSTIFSGFSLFALGSDRSLNFEAGKKHCPGSHGL